MRRCIAIAVLCAMVATPASAQFTVFDPWNLSEAVLISERVRSVYQQIQAQLEVVRRMAEGLRNLERYRIPAIAMTAHDAARFSYGREWLEGLNGGDPRGTAYWRSSIPLQRPDALPAHLSPAARRVFENLYATVEISDSVAMMGGHQVALTRGYHSRLQDIVEFLQQDVLSGLPGFHELTAILDKISAGELLARRQDMAANQLLANALEQLLARNKRQRDSEASTLNMQLTTWRDGEAADRALWAGTGDALSRWRQP